MPHRLLIVDDEHAIRFAMADYFTAQGFEVDAASDRPAARARLAVGSYDVVIVDLRLSGTRCTEGLDVIADIRDSGAPTRVVLLTGSASAEIVATAVARGAAAVLFKSSGLPHVRDVVTGLLGKAEQGSKINDEGSRMKD